MTVAEHVEKLAMNEIVITPSHADRTESPEFSKTKARLHEDGHYKCWVCGSTENLQVHHLGCEWSLEGYVDFKKLKEFCEEWDPYGYGRLLRNIPMTSVDDIRNMLVLDQPHHTGVDHEDGGSGTGIHDLAFPVFMIQKVARDGCNPIPQKGETLEDAEARLHKNYLVP